MKKLLPWIGSAAIISIIFGTIYVSQQQLLRLSANDPQIQTAQSAASQLLNGAALPTQKIGDINVATALDTFTTVYDSTGKPLYSTGELNSKIPTIPKGVLKASDHKDYNAVTWQPQKGVRLAAVSVKAGNKYYVVSARSLAQVEKRDSQLLKLVGFGWTASIVVLILIYGLPFVRRNDTATSAAYVAPEAKHSHATKTK